MKIQLLILIFIFFFSCKKYDNKVLFGKELYKVEIDSKIGIVDENDNVIVPINYKNVRFFNDSATILVGDYKSEGLYDVGGNIIIPSNFRSIQSVIGHNDLFLVHEENPNYGCFLYNREGKCISKKYSQIKDFSENGLAVAQYEKDSERIGYIHIKAGFIDTAGIEVVPIVFDYAHSFSEDLAAVNYQGNWGYIDRTGREVISYQFDNARSFSKPNFFKNDILAVVCINNKWGVINKKGKVVIPYIYDRIGECFEYNVIEVQIKAERYFIDNKGARVKGQRGLFNYISDYSI